LEHRLPTFLFTSPFPLPGLLAGCLLLCLLLCVVLGWLWPCWRRAVRRHRELQARLAERERLAAEVHDSLLQGMQGMLLSFQSVGQRLPAGSTERAAIEHILDQGDAALAEGRLRLQALQALNEAVTPPNRV
jgi:signal transduction histidine kinase